MFLFAAVNSVTIEATDLSPLKPLSRWALMRNELEEKSGSSENSARDSVVDPHDDLDIDDAFGINLDR